MKTANVSTFDLAASCTAQCIQDFIAVGRSKVLGTKADPYRKLSGKDLRKAIQRDANQIYDWLANSSTAKKMVRRYKRIVRIQRGPKLA